MKLLTLLALIVVMSVPAYASPNDTNPTNLRRCTHPGDAVEAGPRSLRPGNGIAAVCCCTDDNGNLCCVQQGYCGTILLACPNCN